MPTDRAGDPGSSTDRASRTTRRSVEPQAAADERGRTVTLVRIPLAGEATDASSEAAVAAITNLRDTYVPAGVRCGLGRAGRR